MKPVIGTQIAENLKGKVSVLTYAEIDSTNNEARRYIQAGLIGPALFIAEKQTGGKGRLGRTFYSPEDAGIYMSLAYPLHASYNEALRVTAKTAVSCLRGLQANVNAALSIKWVNDLYFGDRKAAGILVESVPGDLGLLWVIIGIGINLAETEFPEDLQGIAVSLHAQNADRNAIITSIISDLLWELKNLSDTTYLETYRAYSNVLGEDIRFGVAPDFEEGKAVEIDDQGALIVEKMDGTRIRLSSGEISVRKQSGSVSADEEKEAEHEGPDHTETL